MLINCNCNQSYYTLPLILFRINTNINFETLRLMEFGKDECFRFLVCASDTMLFAWDVITQGLLWKFDQQLTSPINCLIVDPKSIYMAAILKNSECKLSTSRPMFDIT